VESKLQNQTGQTMRESKETPSGKKHKVTFLPKNITVEVDESLYPYQHDGVPGSLLDIALGHKIDIGHNCGGNCACTTCHIVVKEGMENLSLMEDDEEERLDMAEDLTMQSRLGCQAVVKGDVVVEIRIQTAYGV